MDPLGIALLAGFLGPCGMNTPHMHPRATEFLYQVNGSIQSGMLTETGSRFIMNNVTAGKAMILPQVRICSTGCRLYIDSQTL